MLRHIGRGQPPLRRVRRLGALAVSGREAMAAMESTHCLVAGQFAMRLGLGSRYATRSSTSSSAGTARARHRVSQPRRSPCRRGSWCLQISWRPSGAWEGARRRSTSRAAVRAGTSTRTWPATCATTPTGCSAASTRRPDGTPRSRPSRRSPQRSRACGSTRRSRRSLTSPTSSRPIRPDIRAGSPSARRAPRCAPGSAKRPPPSCAARGCCTTSGGSACRTRSGTSRGRCPRRGLSNKQIAARLVVSPRTVGHHVEHLYRKIGCSTRAAASLFATQHGLLPELDSAHQDGSNDR